MQFWILVLVYSVTLLSPIMTLLQSVLLSMLFRILLSRIISGRIPSSIVLLLLTGHLVKFVLLSLMLFFAVVMCQSGVLRRVPIMRNNHAHVSDPHSFLSSIGDRVHKLYQSRFDGSRVVLEECGSFDIQDRINGYAQYTDISYMLNRLSVGDTSVLSSRPPLYGDFSGMPDNPIDAINLYHGAEQAFLQLSPEDRSSYNNDFRLWLSAIMGGTITRSDNHADPKPAVSSVPAEPVPVEKE